MEQRRGSSAFCPGRHIGYVDTCFWGWNIGYSVFNLCYRHLCYMTQRCCSPWSGHGSFSPSGVLHHWTTLASPLPKVVSSSDHAQASQTDIGLTLPRAMRDEVACWNTSIGGLRHRFSWSRSLGAACRWSDPGSLRLSIVNG